jgi:hypothetical protein
MLAGDNFVLPGLCLQMLTSLDACEANNNAEDDAATSIMAQ